MRIGGTRGNEWAAMKLLHKWYIFTRPFHECQHAIICLSIELLAAIYQILQN